MTPQYRSINYRWMAVTAAMTWVFAPALTHSSSAQKIAQAAAHAASPGAPSSNPVPADSAAASKPAAGAKTVPVTIDNFSFAPRTLTVPVGATVTWTNKDDIPHTVVSTKKKFASPALDTDQQFSFHFTAAGTYPYFCSVHPMMTGTVVVKK
jgi:plastocyanin